MDNNHLLLLMIHVFKENEEQLFKVNKDTNHEVTILLEKMGMCLSSVFNDSTVNLLTLYGTKILKSSFTYQIPSGKV